MRALRLAPALLAAVLALAAGGCGGDDTVTPEVPGDPVSVPIPSNPDSLGGGSAAGADADASADPDADATATPDAGTAAPEDQSGTAPAAGTDTTADTGDGTVAPPEDGPQTDTAPPAGSDAEKFEDFCAQNPGAC